MTLLVKPHDGFITFDLKVFPGASKNEICGEQNGALKVKVTAAPEKGKANKELTDYLSSVLGIKKSNVEVIKGEKSRLKSLKIEGVTKTEFLLTVERMVKKSI